MKHQVFVCSEYCGLEENLVLARKYCRYVYEKGYNCFAPHLFYPQFLSEAKERMEGLELGKETLLQSFEIWVFVRDGRLSQGMNEEIKIALGWCIPLRYFDATDVLNIVELPHVSTRELPLVRDLRAPKTFADTTQDRFGSVVAALEKGVKYEDLQKGLDDLLGPSGESERDLNVERDWEYSYRNGRLDE